MNRIRLLGSTTVVVDGDERPVTAPKQRAVLAQLALEPGVALSADRLLDEVWGDRQPAGGPKAVAFQVTKLRDALEPGRVGEGTLVRTTSAGYLLDLSARQIDVHDVVAVIDDAATALLDDADKAKYLAEDALAMWRGRPFADVPSSRAIDEEIRRLDLLHERAQRLLFEAQLARGEHEVVLADVTRYVEQHPLDEAAAALLMRTLDRCGRTADALREFGRLRSRLVEELGIDPSPEVCDLETSILLRERASSSTDASNPPRTSSVSRGRGVPRPATSLVGREPDVAACLERVRNDECRVVTLVGPGGIGKTRLAIEVAHRWTAGTDDAGVAWFVSLASDGRELIEQIAAAVGFVVDQHIVSNGLGPRTQLVDYLTLQRGLLVLDNFEHVIEHAGLVRDIAEQCPDVTVLVTSRERLGIGAEWVRHVAGLDLEGPDPSARRLFVTRAQQAGARLSGVDPAVIHRICVATDGLPLALELAAASAPLLDLATIADQLESNATSLDAVAGVGDDRQRSLAATFEYSWAMLDPALRSMLARLAVFAAPFDAEAAEAVAGVGRSSLARLQMKSLVRRPAPDRYDLHPLIRQLAVERLGVDEPAARAAHAGHYAEFLAARTESLLGGHDQLEVAALVDDEIDNIRAAAAWLATHLLDDDHDDRLRQMLHGLSAYWFIRSLGAWSSTFGVITEAIETSLGVDDAMTTTSYRWAVVYRCYPDAMLTGVGVRDVMERMLPRLDDLHPHATAWCLTNIAICAESDGEIEHALELLHRADEIDADDQPVLHGVVASWLGWELSLLGRNEEAGEVWKGGLARAQQAHNEIARAYLLSKVGLWADDAGEHEVALQCHRESADLFERTGDQGGLGYTLSRLSWSYRQVGDLDAAIEHAARALDQFRQVNHRWGIGASLGRMAHAHLDGGDSAAAAHGFRECLDWGDTSEMPSIVWYGLVGIGLTAAAAGDDERAVVILAHNVVIPQNPYAAPLGRPALDGLAERCELDAFAAAVERGRSMEMATAIRFARKCADDIRSGAPSVASNS